MPIFEEKSGDIFLTKDIKNPFLTTKSPFVRARSRSVLKDFEINKSKRSWHLIQIAIPADVDVARSLFSAPYRLRVMASTQALFKAGFPALHEAWERQQTDSQLEITWDEIGEGGHLKPALRFASFADLAKKAELSRVSFGKDDDVFAIAVSEMRRRLMPETASFDRLLIIKEKWDVSLPAVQELIGFVRDKRQAMRTPPLKQWLSVFSERTPSYGNDYLAVAVKKEFIGTLVEEQADSHEAQVLIRADEFAELLAAESERKLDSSEIATAKPDSILTTSESAAEDTGHIVPLFQIDGIVRILDELQQTLNEKQLLSEPGVITLANLLAKRAEGLQVPKTRAAYHEPMRAEKMPELKSLIGQIRTQLSSLKGGAERSCTHVFATDDETFALPDLANNRAYGSDN